jgi:hypothetical protein
MEPFNLQPTSMMPIWPATQQVPRGKPYLLYESGIPREHWPPYLNNNPSDEVDFEEEEDEDEDENSVRNRHRRLAQAQAEIAAESTSSPTQWAFRTAMRMHDPGTGQHRTQPYAQGKKTRANLFKAMDFDTLQRFSVQLSFILLPKLSIIRFLQRVILPFQGLKATRCLDPISILHIHLVLLPTDSVPKASSRVATFHPHTYRQAITIPNTPTLDSDVLSWANPHCLSSKTRRSFVSNSLFFC